MKRKTLTLTLCLLVCLSLIGVGFASWIITSTNTKSEEGDIIVDVVEDQRLKVTYDWVTDAEGTTTLDTAPELKYGIKDDVTGAPAWLTNTTKESLTAYLKITVKDSKNEAYTNANITATLSAKDGKYTEANTAKLVGDLPTLTAVNKGEGVYILTITLTWGEKFNSKNPAETFANKAVDDALPTGLTDVDHNTCGDYASYYLNELYTKLTGAKYNLDIIVNRATTTA